MNNTNLIKKMEGIIKERTPQYVSLSNPGFDEKLLKAHYLLAKLYSKDGDVSQAHTHFSAAEHEFFNMYQKEIQQPQYITGGKEGFRKFSEQVRKTEEKLDTYKNKLFGIATEIGYDALNLLFAPTNANPRKRILLN